MPMVSLERQKEKKEGDDCCSPSYYHERYPVSIYISSEEFDKLKLGDKKINEEFELAVKVRVTSLSVNQYVDTDGESGEGGEKGGTETRSSATLTVLAADVPDNVKPASDRMFGEKKEA